MNKIITKVRNHKIFSLEGSPEKLAKGFALGSFIGMMPIPGIQVFVALGAASVLKVNKKAACLAVFNTNIVTGIFIFAFNYWLGKLLLGIESDFVFPDKIDYTFIGVIASAGKDVILSMLIGGIITGILSAVLAYYAILYYYNRKKQVWKHTKI